MNYCFLYTGQGSQKVGMGKDFYEEYETYRTFIDSLDLDVDVKRLMQEGPLEELSSTDNTQPCMAAHAAGVTMLLREAGILPAAACGLSLGEYGALYAAGVFSAEDFVKLTRFRGLSMKKAAEGLLCSMSAVLGLPGETIRNICETYEKTHCGEEGSFIAAANYNCAGQTVICGDEQAVSAVEALLKEAGAKRCVRLNVSGPFHTKYMEPAGEALRGFFEGMEWKEAKIPVTANAAGDFYDGAETAAMKELLIRQVKSSVYLEENMKKLLLAGYTDFIEIGPGNTMAGFLKKTAKAMGTAVRVTSIDSTADLRKLLSAVKEAREAGETMA